jgi:hypothetical protein
VRDSIVSTIAVYRLDLSVVSCGIGFFVLRYLKVVVVGLARSDSSHGRLPDYTQFHYAQGFFTGVDNLS